MENAAAQGQRQRDGVIGDLAGAVVGHVTDQHIAFGAGDAVDAVVADAHADDAFEARQARKIFAGDGKAHHHQAIDDRRVGRRQIGQRGQRVAHDGGAVAEDLALEGVVGDLAFGIEDVDWHGRYSVKAQLQTAHERLSQNDGTASGDGPSAAKKWAWL